MRTAFAINREFDFVRWDGLERVTGRSAPEWDLYVLKELIDNALDADDALWRGDPAQTPRVQVRVQYVSLPEHESQQVHVRVSNRAAFPIEQVEQVFATRWYTSRKAFLKGVTRGALGNALKTLLGIPYALRQRASGHWNLELKPLAIRTGGTEYLPRYLVDGTAQAIVFRLDRTPLERGPVDGTEVRVGLDDFVQEVPRTLVDLERLAARFALLNPHAEFTWTIQLDGRTWEKTYSADPGWRDKFHGEAPVTWYTPAAFQELLAALYRDRYGDDRSQRLPVEEICRPFAGVRPKDVSRWAPAGLSASEVDGVAALRLYGQLVRSSPAFDSNKLGRVGREHLVRFMPQVLPVDAEVIYASAGDAGEAGGTPFVLEVAAAALREGRRTLWTAVNFSPTYEDPFFNRLLETPDRPGEPVVGLRGLLDACSTGEETSVVLFLHLVCPAVEHTDFSKSAINHLPFKQAIGEVVHRVLEELARTRDTEQRRLEQEVLAVLDKIVGELGEHERFVSDQLLAKLRARLRDNPAMLVWLQRPEALGRLQDHLVRARNAALTHVARVPAGMLAVPQHPDRHFSTPTDLITPEMLVRHHVNKLLYVQPRALEPVVLANDWLCRLDMAMLLNPQRQEGLREALVQCALGCDLPLLLLHDADDAGRILGDQVRGWLRERDQHPGRVIDLGLDGADGPERLVEMMPNELTAWLQARLASRGVPVKATPAAGEVRRDVRGRFEQLLLGHLWQGVTHLLQVPRLLEDFEGQFHLGDAMAGRKLDEEVWRRLHEPGCRRSYADVRDEMVGQFLEEFLKDHGRQVESLVQGHVLNVRRSP